MKPVILLICLLASGVWGLKAQSIANTAWKTFIADPVNDTLTLHIQTDSSYVTNSGGEVVVRSVCKLSGDTLVLTDFDGRYACPGMEGKYKYSVDTDILILALITDACDGRAGNLNGLKWYRAKAPEKH